MFDWVFCWVCCTAGRFAKTAKLCVFKRILGNRNPSAKQKSPLNIWNASWPFNSWRFKAARFIDLRRIPVQK
jgi:hypothetical protein